MCFVVHEQPKLFKSTTQCQCYDMWSAQLCSANHLNGAASDARRARRSRTSSRPGMLSLDHGNNAPCNSGEYASTFRWHHGCLTTKGRAQRLSGILASVYPCGLHGI
eukprot:4790822-Amphidinium_carterae.3